MLLERIKKEIIYKNSWESNELLETEELLKKMFDHANTPILEQIKYAIEYRNTQDIVNSNLKIIESNEKLAKSNAKYQLALNILTWVLAFVGLVQIFIQIRIR